MHAGHNAPMFLTVPTLLTWARIVAIPLIVGVFSTGLSLAGVDSYWQYLTIGFLIILAVAVDQWLRRATQ